MQVFGVFMKGVKKNKFEHDAEKSFEIKAAKRDSHNLCGFAKKYPGFIIAMAFFIFIVVLFFLFSSTIMQTQAKAISAKELYLQNQELIDSMILEVDYVLSQGSEGNDYSSSTLEDDYLAAFKDDLEWLKDEEKELFNSKPTTSVFAKEIAFSAFMQNLIEINELYLIGPESDYQKKINEALSAPVNVPVLLIEEELNETFTSQEEKDTYHTTLKELFEKYASSKKIFINSINSTERKYVEAKKLVWLLGAKNFKTS